MEAAGREEAVRSQERSGRHSGRLLLRMPEGLHGELARAAERHGLSLNAFITETLAGAVGWGSEAAPSRRRKATAERPAAEPPQRRRLVERLLVANLAVVAAVGVLAIVLLVDTLR